MPEVIAMLTNKTFLLQKVADGKWENFIDITKYPQIGGEAEQVEVTRLCDSVKRYINGLQDSQSLVFEANYTKTDYDKAKALQTAGTVGTFRLCFGDQLGTDGCWEWSGKVSVYLAEGESNGARKMTFSISDEGEDPITEVDPLTEQDIAAG